MERFEAYAGRMEIANAFSESTTRWNSSAVSRASLKAVHPPARRESETIDDDFLMALEHGMPPTGGRGWASIAS